ncbi:MAG: hypothetical protein M3R24_09940 [Chloroflexota bacterium]|nr:hypothetical protein [Chloroflexota bacterium]
MIANALLRLARGVVENVLSQLLQQKNTVLEMALRPMDMMIQQVLGGIWIGKGADAFVQEVRSIMIPGVRGIETSLSTFSGNIKFARERIDRADQDVTRLVTSRIFDTFRFF